MTEGPDARVDRGLKQFVGMEYKCEHCGRTEEFDGLAVEIRSPIRDDADCGICRMQLVDKEAYWNEEIEPESIWYALDPDSQWPIEEVTDT